MKKIINGRVYDTRTAKFLADFDNGCWDRSFELVAEELYIKRTGEYFLYGEGGVNTEYVQRCGYDHYCGGAAITPLTEAEARNWCAEYCSDEVFEEIFGAAEG